MSAAVAEQPTTTSASGRVILSSDERVAANSPQERELTEKYQIGTKNYISSFGNANFDLPAMPDCVAKAMELSMNPNESAQAIQRILHLDPVLTARLLRVANSPIFAGARRIESLQNAITRLGIINIRNVIVAITVNNTIQGSRLGTMANALWNRAISTAVAAQVLAQRLNLPQELAFLLGLMHDIGMVPAWMLAGRLVPDTHTLRHEFLAGLVEGAHCEMGEALSDAWKMPLDVRIIAGCHPNVTSVAMLYRQIVSQYPRLAGAQAKTLAGVIGCVVVADNALCALKLVQGTGTFQIGEKTLASELGLSTTQTLAFLTDLPNILSTNDFKHI